MIEITINVSNATEEEKAKLEELYSKPINQLSKDATLFYQDDNAPKKLGQSLGINKYILSFQSIDDLKIKTYHKVDWSFK